MTSTKSAALLLFQLVTISLVWLLTSRSLAAEARYDLVIRNGRVVDGTGAPWYVADIGIDDGTIVKVGRIEAEQADTVIDANGQYVAPGFVDMMGQTATPLMEDPKSAYNLLTQGITTINAGEGVSAAPLGCTTSAGCLSIEGLSTRLAFS